MGLYRLEDGSGLVASLLAVQRQTVLHYADAAARDAQVHNPVYGTLSFLDFDREIQVVEHALEQGERALDVHAHR